MVFFWKSQTFGNRLETFWSRAALVPGAAVAMMAASVPAPVAAAVTTAATSLLP